MGFHDTAPTYFSQVLRGSTSPPVAWIRHSSHFPRHERNRCSSLRLMERRSARQFSARLPSSDLSHAAYDRRLEHQFRPLAHADRRAAAEPNTRRTCSALQETKCPDDQFPSAPSKARLRAYRRSAAGRIYHGVATVARLPIEIVDRRRFCDIQDCRHISVRFAGRRQIAAAP